MPDYLRMDPFGCDSAGRKYYRFNQFWKEMRIYRYDTVQFFFD